jgi:hypothetical protein
MSLSTTTSKKEMIHIESCKRDDRGIINYEVGYEGGGVREWHRLSDISPNLIPKTRWFSTELMKKEIETMTDALIVDSSDESEEDHSEWSADEGTSYRGSGCYRGSGGSGSSYGRTTICSFGYAPRCDGYGEELDHYAMSDSEYDSEYDSECDSEYDQEN